MWRREEGLAYWLAKGPFTPTRSWRSQLIHLLLRRFGLWNHPRTYGHVSLEIESRTGDTAQGLSIIAEISDGLSSLGRCKYGPQVETAACNEFRCTVRGLDILIQPAVQTPNLQYKSNAGIRQTTLSFPLCCRCLKVGFADKPVHSLYTVQLEPPSIGGRGSAIVLNPAVVSKVTYISTIPHRRQSVNIGMMKTSESESYLQEARVLKGVAMDRSELVAVFRNVPIEMVSRLRYLAAENAIVYTIIRDSSRKHTRVHDLAAVRDAVTQDMHLVPHRTRYQAVTLN